MENKMIVEKDLGPEAKLKLEYKDGEIVLTIDHKGKLGGAGMYGKVDAILLVDAITDIIPGEMDDAILDTWSKKILAKKSA